MVRGACSPACFAVMLALGVAADAQVAGWRTDAAGAYPDADVPADWSDPANVAWSAAMPGWTNSTPVVHGDVVFTQAETDTLVCLDAGTGQVKWQRKTTLQDALGAPNFTEAEMVVFREKEARRRELRDQARQLRRGARNDPAARTQLDAIRDEVAQLDAVLAPLDRFSPPAAHETNGYTSATPVTDGKAVYVVLGSGVVAAYDMAGERLWVRYVQKPPNEWGQSASPLLVGDTVVVLFDDLIGLSAADGQERWRVEKQFTFGSPVTAEVGGRTIIVTPLGALIDPADGRTLGQVERVKLEFNTPLVAENVVYFIYENALAVELEPREDGTVAAKELWTSRLEKDRYYASPLLHDGLLYAVTRGERVSILDAAGGTVEHAGALASGGSGNSAYPSPVLVGDRVYFGTESGRVSVYEPGGSGTAVGMLRLEPFRATPVVAGDRLFLRTTTKLLCLRKPQQAARAE